MQKRHANRRQYFEELWPLHRQNFIYTCVMAPTFSKQDAEKAETYCLLLRKDGKSLVWT